MGGFRGHVLFQGELPLGHFVSILVILAEITYAITSLRISSLLPKPRGLVVDPLGNSHFYVLEQLSGLVTPLRRSSAPLPDKFFFSLLKREKIML